MTEPTTTAGAGRGDVFLTSEAADASLHGYHHRHTARPEHVVDVAEWFRAQDYILEMITCEDRREDASCMRLVYGFSRIGEAERHLVFVDLLPEIAGAEAPSVAGVYRAADWFEREVFDMYGVRFTGHPNLKRLLLPEDADFHALLKDFGRVEDAPGGGEGEG